MKKEIHPEWYPDAEVIIDGEVVMRVGSTKPRMTVDIWSGTHPFFTGEQRLVDTEGQVDRFMRRLRARQEYAKEQEVVEEKRDPRNMEVGIIGLDKRAENALVEAEIETIGDILDALERDGDDALLAIQGIGQKAMIDIRRYLRTEELID